MNIDKQRRKFEKYKLNKASRLKTTKPVRWIQVKKCIRPFMRLCLYIQRLFTGFKIEFINKDLEPTDRQRVFAVSHIGKWDFEIVNEVIKSHFHILAADFMNMQGTVSGIFMKLFGVIFVDETDKDDRHNTKLMMESVLRQGDNMMLFPEAAWNFSENEIIYDIVFGAVDIAINTESVITPICIEQYGNRFVINIGKNFVPTEKVESTRELRDIMASLKWEIWEREGITSRKDIPYDYWSRFIEERVSEWKGYKMSEQITNCYIPKQKMEYFSILRDMRRLHISEKNCFLIMNQKDFISKYSDD